MDRKVCGQTVWAGSVLTTLLLAACSGCTSPHASSPSAARAAGSLKEYTTVRLTADLSGLSPNQRRMIPPLIEAAKQMDAIFWLEACGDKNKLPALIADADLRRLAEINYGPWDRFHENRPLAAKVGPRPEGAEFYPHDMTKSEFEQHLAKHPQDAAVFKSEYTLIRRGQDGSLTAVPYHVAFAAQVQAAAAKLREAAALADDPALRKYLELRAAALLNDEYRESDIAWLDVKDSPIDCVIGPIEHYEDGLFGYKTTHEATIFIKDHEWSRRLAGFVPLLPALQKGLPVPDAYKKETPGSASALGVYDAVYCAGFANAGAKGIGVNLPNDESIQLNIGARRLQSRNVMRAKYDRTLVPIAALMIAADQRGHVTFDAMFEDVLFHEVAHGLGVKNTITGKGLVREALKEQGEPLEEAKADIVGLHIIAELRRQGRISEGELADNYVTYLADTMRVNRFGGADAYGQTSMLTFNFFKQRGAITRDAASGTYRVNIEQMGQAVEALAAKLLVLQGDGDYEAAKAFAEASFKQDPQLEADLEPVRNSNIPVDLAFEQGLEVLTSPP